MSAFSTPRPRQMHPGRVPKMGGASGLADVLEVVLDKGIVIDIWARVSIIGIEILTVEARIVIASVETYLRYAEAIGLTALAAAPRGGGESNGRVQPPDKEEIFAYLEDHPEGLRLGEMESYFDVPRHELGEIVEELIDDGRVQRDDDQKLYYAIDTGDNDEDQE
jgi:gas vesicle structural protein